MVRRTPPLLNCFMITGVFTRLRYFFLLTLIGWLPIAEAQEDPLGIQRRLISVFDENQASVVRIKAAFESFDEGERKVSLRVGTGYFVSADGMLLTNTSVTLGARKVWAEQNGISYPLELVGADMDTNIALLRIQEERAQPFEYITINERSYPSVGTMILSIGCALEFDPAPRMGLVSGKNTNFGQRVFPTTYMRTTIAANPGEGGAPVLDLNGRFLGMIVASIPEISASYVIPANAVARVKNDLILNGSVRYGWIGLELENQPRDHEDLAPLVITEIVENGPSGEAGIHTGDRIISVNNEPVTHVGYLREIFFLSRVGQYLDFELERNGQVIHASLKIAVRPESETNQ